MKVLISGAGIAGLSLALRLRQRGLAPIVVERSPRLRGGGYMLGLADPGLDAAKRMGVVDAPRAVRHLPRRLVSVGAHGRERSPIDARSGVRLHAGRGPRHDAGAEPHGALRLLVSAQREAFATPLPSAARTKTDK